MRYYRTRTVTMCIDCAMWQANADDSGIPAECVDQVHAASGVDAGWHVVVGDETTYNDYSRYPCDVCGSKLHGARQGGWVMHTEAETLAVTEEEADQVVTAFLACARWADAQDAYGDPAPDDAEWADSAQSAARDLVGQFLSDPALVSDLHFWADNLGAEQIGHDLWLTMNGHGAGFWDRGKGAIGDRLSSAAKRYGSRSVELGDDDLLYLS